MMVDGLCQVFVTITGANIPAIIGGTAENPSAIFIMYGVLVSISVLVSVIAILVRFCKSRSNEIEIKYATISIFKYSLINFVIVLILPLIIILITYVLNLFSSSLLKAIGIVGDNGAGIKYEMAKNLYWVGYMNQIPNPGIGITVQETLVNGNFGPPNIIFTEQNVSINNFNYIIQIPSILLALFVPLYFCWTFIQKIVEIFTLAIIMPIAITSNYTDDGARFKILMKSIFKKVMVVIWSIIGFWLFQFLITVMFQTVPKMSGKNLDRGVVYLISIIALSIAILSTGFLLSRGINEKMGIIGSYRSATNTYSVSKQTLSTTLLDRNSESYKKNIETITDTTLRNKNSIDSLKSMIERNNTNENIHSKKNEISKILNN